jgi:Zn-dependent peptidase ImmA (M78 family)/transcriptional regulator with XRE-family HTH domain
MLDQEVLGQLLRAARERAKLTQAQAAAAVGLNRVVLSYYENGVRQPSLPMLAALARIYGLTVSQLLEGVERQPDTAEVLFRTTSPGELGDAARAGMAQFSSLVDRFVELLEDLDAAVPGAGVSPLAPARAGAGSRDAARLAREARSVLGLGDGPIGDHLFSIADDWALVFRLPLGQLEEHAPSGFFYNHPRAGFCVVVNSETTLGRQVFTLAHELAHAFFHSQAADAWISFPGSPTGRERFADFFAGELLVPEDSLIEAVDELSTPRLTDPVAVVHLQRYFGVSYATLLVRLRQERLISEQTYRELRDVSPSKLAAALGYEVSPADFGDYAIHPLDRLPPRMLRRVAAGLSGGRLTRGDAAEILGVSLEEVLRLTDRPTASDVETRAMHEIEAAARVI